MGGPRGGDSAGRKRSSPGVRIGCDAGPRNPDGTWVAGVERGPYGQLPFPVGYQRGELTVVAWGRKTRGDGTKGAWHPVVRCSCGAVGMVDRQNFAAGKSTRCNKCAKLASARTRKRYWGYADILPDDAHRERLLNRISSVISRCHSPRSSQLHNYGGRGIAVAPEWRSGAAGRREFLAYLLTLDGWDRPEFDLDRINNDAGYEPGNLRFVTKSENIRNRRTVAALQREVDDLRHRLRRAEEQIHGCDHCRATYRP